jgi:hypothetical protein
MTSPAWRPALCGGAWTPTVPLSGQNKLTAIATDGAGAKQNASIMVTYSP